MLLNYTALAGDTSYLKPRGRAGVRQLNGTERVSSTLFTYLPIFQIQQEAVMRNMSSGAWVRNTLSSRSGLAGLRNALRVRQRDRCGPLSGPGEGLASHRGWEQESIGGGPAIMTSVSRPDEGE